MTFPEEITLAGQALMHVGEEVANILGIASPTLKREDQPDGYVVLSLLWPDGSATDEVTMIPPKFRTGAQ